MLFITHNDFTEKDRTITSDDQSKNSSHVRTDTERNVSPTYLWRLSFCTSKPWRLSESYKHKM
ncbi:unnamed protein product [Brassica oleracea]